MTEVKPSHTTNLRVAVEEVLWRIDPAVIHDSQQEAPDEYDGLVSPIVAAIKRGMPAPEITAWLDRALRRDWDVQLQDRQSAALTLEWSALRARSSRTST